MEIGLYSLRQFKCVRCDRHYYNNHPHTCEDIVKSIIIIQRYWRGYKVRSNFNIWEQIYHPEGNLFKKLKIQFNSLNI